MNSKWCFSVLIAILTLFGIQQSQVTLPNQEIVVQFTDVDISSDEAHNAIAQVKSQLQLLGADNIQVQEGFHGILKISYYSDSDVESIKKVLTDKRAINLDYAQQNQDEKSSENNTNAYNLDVYEIIDASNTDWDIEGISIVELKSENHRFFNPNIYTSVETIDNRDRITRIALKVNTHIALAIDNSSFRIPETRAGPLV